MTPEKTHPLQEQGNSRTPRTSEQSRFQHSIFQEAKLQNAATVRCQTTCGCPTVHLATAHKQSRVFAAAAQFFLSKNSPRREVTQSSSDSARLFTLNQHVLLTPEIVERGKQPLSTHRAPDSKATLPTQERRTLKTTSGEGAIKVAAPGNAAGVAGIGTNIAANGSRSPNPEAFELRTASDDGIIPLQRSQIKSLLTNKEPVHKMHSNTADRHQGPKPRTWQTVPT